LEIVGLYRRILLTIPLYVSARAAKQEAFQERGTKRSERAKLERALRRLFYTRCETEHDGERQKNKRIDVNGIVGGESDSVSGGTDMYYETIKTDFRSRFSFLNIVR
jgi:hypothetical protein